MDAFPLSHSRAEGGENAGRNSWNSSLEQAEETPLLDTEEKLEAMRDRAKSSGAWDAEERAAWTPQEVNALFLQLIAGDIRETGADDLEGIDWEAYEANENICHNLFKGTDGKIYYQLDA